MKIVICDDESASVEALVSLVAAYGARKGSRFEIRSFLRGEELLAAIARGERFDLYFLDIFLGQLSGFQIAETIRSADADCGIVFVTNSQDHAVTGYRVRALHYLLKPIQPADVDVAMDYAMEALRMKPDRSVQVRNKQGLYRILLGDVAYAESDLRLVNIHTRNHGCISYYDRLDNFERLVADARFLRCHKSYLVNLDYVRRVESGCLTLESGAELRVSIRPSEVTAALAKRMADALLPPPGRAASRGE